MNNIYDVWIGNYLIGRTKAKSGKEAIEKLRPVNSPSPATAYDAIQIIQVDSDEN